MKHVMSAYVNHAWFSSSTQQVLSKEGKVSYSTGSRLTDKESDALPTVPHRPCLPCGYTFVKQCIVVSLNCAPNAKTHTPVVGSETYRTNVN